MDGQGPFTGASFEIISVILQNTQESWEGISGSDFVVFFCPISKLASAERGRVYDSLAIWIPMIGRLPSSISLLKDWKEIYGSSDDKTSCEVMQLQYGLVRIDKVKEARGTKPY